METDCVSPDLLAFLLTLPSRLSRAVLRVIFKERRPHARERYSIHSDRAAAPFAFRRRLYCTGAEAANSIPYCAGSGWACIEPSPGYPTSHARFRSYFSGGIAAAAFFRCMAYFMARLSPEPDQHFVPGFWAGGIHSAGSGNNGAPSLSWL